MIIGQQMSVKTTPTIYYQNIISSFASRKILVLVLSIFTVIPSHTQSALSGEVWGGYIQSYYLGKNWSLWNDFHYVPNSFVVGRHGLTYQIPRGMAISGGYAWLLTASPAEEGLTRRESRLWMQAEQFHELNTRWTLRWRFRYDARYRQNLESGIPIDTRSLTHRPRFLLGFRYHICELSASATLTFNLLNEFIVQHNSTVPLHWVDQHRIFFMPTLRYKQSTIMLGPLLRLLPSTSSGMSYRLGPCLLVIQNFRKAKPPKVYNPEEFPQLP